MSEALSPMLSRKAMVLYWGCGHISKWKVLGSHYTLRWLHLSVRDRRIWGSALGRSLTSSSQALQQLAFLIMAGHLPDEKTGLERPYSSVHLLGRWRVGKGAWSVPVCFQFLHELLCVPELQ